MLSKLNNVLCEQLAKNLAEQDFYKNVCTEILMKNEVVMRLLHPSMVKDERTGKDVFPECAQNDIDKEYEPMIALCFSFSMKNDKQQLEAFKARVDFGTFKEVKDFGARLYAINYGTEVEKAAEKCVDIIKDIYEGDKAKNIKVSTSDIANGIEYAKKTITPPKKEPAPVKVDGIAMRVVVDKEESVAPPVVNDAEKGKEPIDETPVKEGISDTKYNTAMWVVGIAVAVFVLFNIFRESGKDIGSKSKVEQFMDSVDKAANSSYQLSVEERNKILGIDKKQEVKQEVKEKPQEPQVDVLGKWRESYSGRAGYVWQLEKMKKGGKYQVSILHPVGVQTLQETYQCKKQTKNYGGNLFYDPEVGTNNGVFNLKPGYTLYVIEGFDVNGENAVMVMMPGNMVRVYLYNMDTNCFELFEKLQPIN